MGISNTFNSADLYKFKKNKVLYPEENSGSSYYEVEGNDIEQLAEWIEEKFLKTEKAHNRNFGIWHAISDRDAPYVSGKENSPMNQQ